MIVAYAKVYILVTTSTSSRKLRNLIRGHRIFTSEPRFPSADGSTETTHQPRARVIFALVLNLGGYSGTTKSMPRYIGYGMREAGNNATWTDAGRLLHALPSHRKEKGSRTRRHRIPDIVATDHTGNKLAVDCMITRAKPKLTVERSAARAGEKMKEAHYARFLQKCTSENPHDPRLRTRIVPFVLETHGAAGPEACRPAHGHEAPVRACGPAVRRQIE